MKQYVVVNISEQSRVTVDYFMKTLSSRFTLIALKVKLDLKYRFSVVKQ